MGKYINTNSKGLPLPPNKVKGLLEDGATEITDEKFVDDMVCIVDNGPFMAAAFCDTLSEYEQFKYPCGRKKWWLHYPNASKVAW